MSHSYDVGQVPWAPHITAACSSEYGPGSVVGIATGYGLDGPGIESRWGKIFRTYPDRPWGPPSLLYNGYRVFPGGKERPRHDAVPSPTSGAVVMKGQSYTSTPPMGRTDCAEPQCLYKGALYLTLPVPLKGQHPTARVYAVTAWKAKIWNFTYNTLVFYSAW